MNILRISRLIAKQGQFCAGQAVECSTNIGIEGRPKARPLENRVMLNAPLNREVLQAPPGPPAWLVHL